MKKKIIILGFILLNLSNNLNADILQTNKSKKNNNINLIDKKLNNIISDSYKISYKIFDDEFYKTDDEYHKYINDIDNFNKILIYNLFSTNKSVNNLYINFIITNINNNNVIYNNDISSEFLYFRYKKILKYIKSKYDKSNKIIKNNHIINELKDNNTVLKFIFKIELLTSKYFNNFTINQNSLNLTKLLISMMYIESNFNISVIGDNNHSKGLLQINKNTVKFLYKDNNINDELIFNFLNTPINNIDFSLKILKYKYNDFNKRISKNKKLKNKILNINKKIQNKSKFYKKYFFMISMYNGGLDNYNYVNKIFKEYDFLNKIN